jgi:alpha-tubulin suppressor-like RCC1 family protein
MSHLRSSAVILGVIFLFINNNSNATVTCAHLKSVSAGEYHTLAIADDNSLWACGHNGWWETGLGRDISSVSSLKQVRGENGIGFLRNIVSYDAGWKHSLAVDINGTIYAWGTDDCNQLGNGYGPQNSEFPAKVLDINGTGFLSHIVDV